MVTVSPPVSPSVVAAIFMTQKKRVTSGTLDWRCSAAGLVSPSVTQYPPQSRADVTSVRRDRGCAGLLATRHYLAGWVTNRDSGLPLAEQSHDSGVNRNFLANSNSWVSG